MFNYPLLQPVDSVEYLHSDPLCWSHLWPPRWSRQDPSDPRPLRPGDVAVRAGSCSLASSTKMGESSDSGSKKKLRFSPVDPFTSKKRHKCAATLCFMVRLIRIDAKKRLFSMQEFTVCTWGLYYLLGNLARTKNTRLWSHVELALAVSQAYGYGWKLVYRYQ